MIYLASGFFCPRELDRISKLETALDSLGIDYFSPRKGDNNDLPMEEKLKPENAQKIFEMDCAHMDECVGMFAYLGGAKFYNHEKDKVTWALDSGVLFEMGYMKASGKPIIGFADDGQAMNLMLARALDGFFPNYTSFLIKLAKFHGATYLYGATDLFDELANGPAESSE